MTYKELANTINSLSEESQNCDVTVACDTSHECLPSTFFHCIEEGDMLEGVLDIGHPIIRIDY